MTPRHLFSIILKILGVLFVKDILLAIPQLVLFLTYNLRDEEGVSFGALALFVLSVGAYVVTAYYLVFKTGWVIEKFRLEEGFEEGPLPLNIHRSTVLSIAIIVIGGLMVVNVLPFLVRECIQYYQYSKGGYFDSGRPNKSYLISYVLQLVIGLLLMGQQRQLVNLIEARRKPSLPETSPKEDPA